MKTLQAQKAGLATGLFLAIIHLGWVIIVALGWGQTLHDSIMRIHMIQSPTTIGPFTATNAIALVLMALVVGYVLGWLFATVWNRINR